MCYTLNPTPSLLYSRVKFWCRADGKEDLLVPAAVAVHAGQRDRALARVRVQRVCAEETHGHQRA